MIVSTTIERMAEHVFKSALVEEFYNTCHGPDGRFCSGGGKKGRVGSKGAAGNSKGYGSGKTAPSALKMTEKYGTRGAGAGAKKVSAPAGSASKKAGGTSGSKFKPDAYGSGKTNPDALRMTNKFGTRGARPAAKKKESSIKYGADKSGSGKTEPSALEITRRFGTRRG